MKNKYIKLIAGIVFDILGILPLFIPALGEIVDIIWAPVSSMVLLKMYGTRKGKYGAILNFLEELLPVTDFIPSFTITWCYFYFFEKEKILH